MVLERGKRCSNNYIIPRNSISTTSTHHVSQSKPEERLDDLELSAFVVIRAMSPVGPTLSVPAHVPGSFLDYWRLVALSLPTEL